MSRRLSAHRQLSSQELDSRDANDSCQLTRGSQSAVRFAEYVSMSRGANLGITRPEANTGLVGGTSGHTGQHAVSVTKPIAGLRRHWP